MASLFGDRKRAQAFELETDDDASDADDSQNAARIAGFKYVRGKRHRRNQPGSDEKRRKKRAKENGTPASSRIPPILIPKPQLRREDFVQENKEESGSNSGLLAALGVGKKAFQFVLNIFRSDQSSSVPSNPNRFSANDTVMTSASGDVSMADFSDDANLTEDEDSADGNTGAANTSTFLSAFRSSKHPRSSVDSTQKGNRTMYMTPVTPEPPQDSRSSFSGRKQPKRSILSPAPKSGSSNSMKKARVSINKTPMIREIAHRLDERKDYSVIWKHRDFEQEECEIFRRSNPRQASESPAVTPNRSPNPRHLTHISDAASTSVVSSPIAPRPSVSSNSSSPFSWPSSPSSCSSPVSPKRSMLSPRTRAAHLLLEFNQQEVSFSQRISEAATNTTGKVSSFFEQSRGSRPSGARHTVSVPRVMPKRVRRYAQLFTRRITTSEISIRQQSQRSGATPVWDSVCPKRLSSTPWLPKENDGTENEFIQEEEDEDVGMDVEDQREEDSENGVVESGDQQMMDESESKSVQDGGAMIRSDSWTVPQKLSFNLDQSSSIRESQTNVQDADIHRASASSSYILRESSPRNSDWVNSVRSDISRQTSALPSISITSRISELASSNLLRETSSRDSDWVDMSRQSSALPTISSPARNSELTSDILPLSEIPKSRPSAGWSPLRLDAVDKELDPFEMVKKKFGSKLDSKTMDVFNKLRRERSNSSDVVAQKSDRLATPYLQQPESSSNVVIEQVMIRNMDVRQEPLPLNATRDVEEVDQNGEVEMVPDNRVRQDQPPLEVTRDVEVIEVVSEENQLPAQEIFMEDADMANGAQAVVVAEIEEELVVNSDQQSLQKEPSPVPSSFSPSASSTSSVSIDSDGVQKENVNEAHAEDAKLLEEAQDTVGEVVNQPKKKAVRRKRQPTPDFETMSNASQDSNATTCSQDEQGLRRSKRPRKPRML